MRQTTGSDLFCDCEEAQADRDPEDTIPFVHSLVSGGKYISANIEAGRD